MVKRLSAEFLGTAALVFMGCMAYCFLDYISLVSVALTFGLVFMVLAYSIGGISGCHLNPAVSLAMLVTGRMKPVDCVLYIIVQFAGGFLGAFGVSRFTIPSMGMGANVIDPFYSTTVGFGVEVVFTLIFVFVFLRVSADESLKAVAPMVIGAALTLVHLVGIDMTGTSVNPARSLAPALFTENALALEELWVFLLAPLVGGLLAGGFYWLTQLGLKKKN